MEIQLIEKLKNNPTCDLTKEEIKMLYAIDCCTKNNFYFYRDDRDQYYEDLCKNI